MKLSFRLLLLLTFLALVLPNLLPHLGYRQTQRLQEKEDHFRQQYDDLVSSRESRFSASIQALRITDPAFERCLNNELDFYSKMGAESSGAIDDIDELKVLRCDGYGIKSLDGIDGLTNLTQLSLIRNDIKSLYPLRYHPALQSINLDDNPNINSIEVLASIKTLKSVSFPRLNKTHCDAAKDVDSAIKSRHGSRARSNISSIRCSG